MYREIYLDNSATTKPFEKVIEYMNETALKYYGNPSSLHRKGIEAEKLVKAARSLIANSLHADNSEIVFTSSGTESNNLAIKGYIEANPRKGNHLITSEIEHPSVLEVFRHLSEKGFDVDYIQVDSQGLIDLDMLEAKIRPDTAIISIMLVNNETGTIQPYDEIVKIRDRKNPNAVLHADAVQAYGKIPLNPEKSGIDLMSLSSHKIHGPKGVGALYVNRRIKIKPILHGGGQESLIRSGTENVPGICGFGLASELTVKNLKQSFERVAGLKELFLKRMSESSCEYKVISPQSASPYILNVTFPGIKAEVLLHHLEERNIYVSTGSACSSRKNLYSHVLKAMGLETFEMEGAIRFSFSTDNNEQDIETTVQVLNEIVPKLQRIRGGRR